MSKIIVSYRRSDSAAIAGRIFDRLTSHYGDERVFMDIDKIPFGTDFRKHIKGVLEGGGILLAVVGPNWLGKAADGNRMTDEADPVRLEIETAMRQGMTVLPVLVDGAAMPGAAELPESMRDFAFINAAPLDIGRDFRTHMERVIRAMDGILGEVVPPPKPPPPETQIERGYPNQPAPPEVQIERGYPAAPKPKPPRWRAFALAGAALALVAMVAGLAMLQKSPPASPTTTGAEALSKIVPPAAPASNETGINEAATAANVSKRAPPAETYRVLATVSGGVQNLRGGPAVKYPLVVAIPAGATGIAVSTCRASEDGTRPWCAATWRTYSGWISSCCIVDEKTGAAPRIE